MLNAEEMSIFGDITQTTFGKQSSPMNSHTHSTTARLVSPSNFIVNFITIVSYFGYTPSLAEKQLFENEATQVTNAHIKKIREAFKEETGRTLEFKIIDTQDNNEILNSNPYSNNKKTAYMKRRTMVEIVK